jgi:hypothetical protein
MLLSDLEIGSENASLPIQKSAAMVESIYIYIYIYILLGVYTGDSVHAGNSESVPLLGVPTKSGVRTRSQKQRGRTGRVSPSPAILWLYTARILGDSIIPWNNMRLLASWRSIRWMCVVYLKPNWLPSELPVCIDFSSGTDSTLQMRMQEVLLDLWFFGIQLQSKLIWLHPLAGSSFFC